MTEHAERFSLEWWMEIADRTIGLPSEDPHEFQEWLFDGWYDDRDEALRFAEVFVEALQELLSFDAIVEFDIHISQDKPVTYLIMTVVDKKTLICVTAEPQYNRASWYYILDTFDSIEELNDFLKEVAAEIEDCYRKNVRTPTFVNNPSGGDK